MPGAISANQLAAVEKLSRLLQQGPLTGPNLTAAVQLAAEGGDVGASLLKSALQADAFEQRPAYATHTGQAQHDPVQKPKVDDCASTGSCGDVTPPQTPYTQVFLGQFVDPQRPRDPLVMRFSGLEKDASVFLINRRTHLDVDRSDKANWVQIPWNGELDAEGRANVVISDDEAGKLGIKSGDVLEIFQRDKAGNTSGSDWVAINEKAPGGRINNPVGGGPTTWVGVQSDVQRPQFLMNADPTPPSVNASAIAQRVHKDRDRWELVLTPEKGKLALEPFSKVIVDRPPFFTGHYTQDVKRNGSFEIKTSDAAPQDAVVLRVLDHSTGWKMGDGPKPSERRVVLAAGGRDAVVVDNPAAGTQKQIEASKSRITIAQDRIEGCAGSATPGAIVMIINQSTGKKTTTAVGSDGSFSRPLDGKLKANVGDQISIQLVHAFDEPGLRHDLGVHEMGCDARTLDKVGSTKPVGSSDAGRLKVAIDDASLSFSTYDWNTGNYVGVRARADWSGRMSSVATYDAAKEELVVTLDVLRTQNDGAVRTGELGESKHTQGHFGAAMRSNYSNDNRDAQIVREQVQRRGVGGSLNVRFQTADGHVFSTGTLRISSEVRTHSTGSSQKDHPVFVAKLDPSSLT